MQITKASQTAYKGRKRPKASGCLTEEPVQKQLNDMLAAHGIWQVRIADGFFRWIKMNAPAGIQRWFFGMFGGIPDSLAMIKVSDKYMLCCPIECKSKTGQRHGKQKHWESKNIPFQISRSPETSIEIVDMFLKDVDTVRGFLGKA